MLAGGSYCHLWKNDRAPCSEGFLFEGVAHFLTNGGKKTPRMLGRCFHGWLRLLAERLFCKHWYVHLICFK